MNGHFLAEDGQADGLLNARGGVTKGGGSKNSADGSSRQNVAAPGARLDNKATKKKAAQNANKGGMRGGAQKGPEGRSSVVNRPTPPKGRRPLPPRTGEKKQQKPSTENTEAKKNDTKAAEKSTTSKSVSTPKPTAKPTTKPKTRTRRARTGGRNRTDDSPKGKKQD